MLEALYQDEPAEVEWDHPEDEIGARNLMILIQKMDRRIEQKKKLRAEVAELYDLEIDRARSRMEEMRESLRVFIEDLHGGEAVRFPEVGTASLRKVAEKMTVEDAGVAEEWANEFGHVKTLPDLVAAKRDALERMKVSGEVPRGFEYVPETRTLVVRAS